MKVSHTNWCHNHVLQFVSFLSVQGARWTCKSAVTWQIKVGARLTLFTNFRSYLSAKTAWKIWKLTITFYETWRIIRNFCEILAAWLRAKLAILWNFTLKENYTTMSYETRRITHIYISIIIYIYIYFFTKFVLYNFAILENFMLKVTIFISKTT